MPTRISKEKLGHTLEVREHLDEQPGAHYLFPIRPVNL